MTQLYDLSPFLFLYRAVLIRPPSIIFRAFQGLGASGVQAISIIIIPDLIPLPKMLNYSSLVSMTLILGLIVGLFLGGWISNEGSWRWVFYIKYVSNSIPITGRIETDQRSGPCGVTALLATLALPWNHPLRVDLKSNGSAPILEKLRKVDWLGCFLLVLSSVPLIFALIEADVLLPWKSAAVIVCLILSGLGLVGLAVQQTFLFRKQTNIKPIVPVELFTKRFSSALLL